MLTRLASWFGARRRAAAAGRSLVARADAARDAGRFAEAAALYLEALDRLPGEAGLRVQGAHMLKEAGDLAAAGRHYALAEAARPRDADLALQVGHFHKLASRYDEASRAYGRAARLRPGWAEPVRERDALFATGWDGSPQTRPLAEAARTIAASGLFDDDVYRRLNPDLAPGTLPLHHYLTVGARQDRLPHPLFDTAHYRAAYPDVARAAHNPLDDFIRRGVAERRDPNPWFDAAWYVANNPDVLASGLDLLSHYQRVGAPRGAHPSPRFDPGFYLANDPDVVSTGMEPLDHYLTFGHADGRATTAAAIAPGSFRPVMAARLRCLREPETAPEVALFVAYAPDGRLAPHVPPYLDALRRQGIATTLVVTTDVDPGSVTVDGAPEAAGLYVRENDGYDFAAWAHVLRVCPAPLAAERLYLLNDSLFGPTNEADFAAMLARARAHPADVLGATECYERARHIQSYFLLIKRRALRHPAFRAFVDDIVAYADKDDVINAYEIRLRARMAAAGLACATLFEAGGRSNPALFRWRALLEAGFPFLKVGVARDRVAGVDAEGWREALATRGYDVTLADRTLAEAGRRGPAGRAAHRSTTPFR